MNDGYPHFVSIISFFFKWDQLSKSVPNEMPQKLGVRLHALFET